MSFIEELADRSRVKASGDSRAAGGQGGGDPSRGRGQALQTGRDGPLQLPRHPVGRELDGVMKWGVWFYPKGEKPKYETLGEVQVRATMAP